MDSIGQSARELQALLRPIVELLRKEIQPAKDEISLNVARHKYPRRWVDAQLEKGNLDKVHRGNKWMVSEADLACLWAAAHRAPSVTDK